LKKTKPYRMPLAMQEEESRTFSVFEFI